MWIIQSNHHIWKKISNHIWWQIYDNPFPNHGLMDNEWWFFFMVWYDHVLWIYGWWFDPCMLDIHYWHDITLWIWYDGYIRMYYMDILWYIYIYYWHDIIIYGCIMIDIICIYPRISWYIIIWWNLYILFWDILLGHHDLDKIWWIYNI